MANTTVVYARIDKDLKANAEKILAQLGISPTSAIQMFYSQIVLKKGIPFDLRLSTSEPIAVKGMTKEEFDNELLKGLDSMRNEKIYTTDEVDEELKKEFGI